MKHLTKPNILSCLCALGGAAVLCLRLWFLETGVDSRGLLDTGHIGNTLSFVLTALTVLPCVFFCLKEPGAKGCRSAASPLAALGAALGCVGLAAAAWALLSNASGVLPVTTGVLGALSVPCAAFLAFCRFKGLRVNTLAVCILLVFFILHPIQLYRLWSAETQLPGYFFQLLGSVCLLLLAYQRAALEMRHGSWQTYLLLRHCAVFFCIAAIPGSNQGVFYLTMAAWMLLDGLSVSPEKRERHEAA